MHLYNREVLSQPDACLQAVIDYQKGNAPKLGRCYPIAIIKASSFDIPSMGGFLLPFAVQLAHAWR